MTPLLDLFAWLIVAFVAIFAFRWAHEELQWQERPTGWIVALGWTCVGLIGTRIAVAVFG